MLISFLFFAIFNFSAAQSLNRLSKTVDDEANSTYMAEQDEFLNRLFNGYRADKAPSSAQGPLDVTLNFYIHHLSIPKIQNPTIRFNSIISLVWYDDRLGWNPADENGKMMTVVPNGYRIWMPFVNFLAKGYTSRIPIHAFKSRTIKLRVSDPSRYKRAKVTMLFRFDGSFDCEASGSFPFEQLDCLTRFLLVDPIFRSRLKVNHSNFSVFSLAPLHMDEDTPEELINGWKIQNGVQKIRYFDPFNFTNMYVDDARDSSTVMSLVECQLALRRAGWTLPVVVLSAILVSAFILITAWLTPTTWSIYILISLIYSTSISVHLALGKVVILSDSLPGIDLFVIVIWAACCLSLLFHLVVLYFPYETKQRFLIFSPLFRKWSFYKSLEEIIATKESTEILSLELEFIRTIIAVLLLCSLSITLIRMS